MKSEKLDVRTGALDRKLRADVLFVPVTVEKSKVRTPRLTGLSKTAGDRLGELLKRHRRLAQAGAIDDILVPGAVGPGRIALVSLGAKRPAEVDDVLKAAASAQKWCREHDVGHAAVAAEALLDAAGDGAVAFWVEGFVLGGFRYVAMRSRSPEPDAGAGPRRLTMVGSGKTWPTAAAMKKAQAVAECTNLARFLGHEPPNVINPVTLAARCRMIAKRHGLRCKVFDDRRLKREKCGAMLAVGRGSASKPRMIILEHTGGKSKARPIVLVGKALTMDTGGYSIKPAASIPDMKYDKQGGVTVIAALVAAARLKLRRRVIGIVGAAENMISADAYRPGDIVRAASGKTIEVLNTDAEGRLVLADCLYYGDKTFKPAVMINLATLTGAIVVALGDACAGLMSNNDKLANALIESGERTRERLWRLPLWPVYREQIKGTDGDIKNTGDRGAGSITAGMFLKEFVGAKTPWAHLDIAGTATTTKATPICPVGATGFGVRLLLDFLQRR
jgi:leucyl aminopeptidase